MSFCTRGLVLFLIFGCAGSHPQLFREDYYPVAPNHLIYHIGLDAEGRKQGSETWWYENGAKKYEGMNDSGLRNGMFRGWYPDGKRWYQGEEVHGMPEDSLIYWYPNGRFQTVAMFRNGVQVHYQTFDSIAPAPVDTLALKRRQDSLQAQLRRQGIAEWGSRVRATVEPFWILPKKLLRHPYRAVVLLRIGRMGDLRNTKWTAKSSSSTFNRLASRALERIKRYPVFPPMVPDTVLEIQYEFVTYGKSPLRRKLILKGSPPPPPSNSALDSSLSPASNSG